MFLEVLLDPAGPVVAADVRIDALGDHLGAPGARGACADASVEDQRDLLRPPNVEVVADELFEERSPGRGPVEHPGVGDFELAKRQLVDITDAHIRPRQRRGQPPLPAPEEAFHRARAEPVTDPLQCGGILAVPEAVVQGGVADADPLALALRPGVPVEPDPHRPRGVGVGLPKRPTPLGIPQVEVEVVDETHLPAPLHVRMRRALGPWPSKIATAGSFPARCRSAPLSRRRPRARQPRSAGGRSAPCSRPWRTGAAEHRAPWPTGAPRRRRRRRSCRKPPTMESKTPSASTETDTPRPPTAASEHSPARRSDPPSGRSKSRDPAVGLRSRPSSPPWSQQP